MRERLASETISACIVCRNEGDRLEECLASVAWADEILVLDLESADGSADVARRHAAQVITRPPVPTVEQVRNEVASYARGDWILALDPDERVSPGLARELDSLRDREDVDLVEIPFMHMDFGHAPVSPRLRYDHKPRMYRRSRVEWPTFPNKLPEAPAERIHRIPARDELVVVHVRNRTVAEAIERVLRYAPATAEARLAAGQTFTAREMVRTLTGKARRQYLLTNAFEEGVPGVVRATVLVAFHFYVWAAFWQMSGAPKTPEDDAYIRRLGLAVRVLLGAARVAGAPLRAGRRLRRVGARARRARPLLRGE
ncbi:MAG: glycosyltransferase [Thermoleophilia bacterium]|nr:glycosyltransferase [Thermoleophilia bacterium]